MNGYPGRNLRLSPLLTLCCLVEAGKTDCLEEAHRIARFERTGDRDFLLAGRLILERWLDLTHANPTDISMAAGTEAGCAKPCAMAYRGLHRLLGALHRNGDLEVYEYPALRERRAAASAAR